MVSPVLVPVWVAGLLAPFRRPALRSLRFVPLTYGVLALAYLIGDGKAYYLASLYPLLLGLGAMPAADWAARARSRTVVLVAAITLSAAVSAVIALPLLPERSLQGSIVMAINPDQGETVGWPRFVDTVARAWSQLPPAERRRTAIFTPTTARRARSTSSARRTACRAPTAATTASATGAGRGAADTRALLIGYDGPSDAAPSFTGCRRLATIDNGVGLDNDEQGLPLLLCRPSASWAALWPRLTHFN